MNFKKIGFVILLIVIMGVLLKFMANTGNKNVSVQSSGNQTANADKTFSEGDLKNTIDSITTEEQDIPVGEVRKASEIAQIDSNNILEITDNFFIEKTNDIYINTDDYIGKTIKLEGLVYSYEDTNGDILYAVVRNTPGCCGNDGLAGLDIRYKGDYPKEDTWVEVVGVMGTDTVYNSQIPALQVGTITEKEEGKTFLSN